MHLGGGMPKHLNLSTDGESIHLYMNYWPLGYGSFITDHRPSLHFHGHWQNPKIVMDDGGTGPGPAADTKLSIDNSTVYVKAGDTVETTIGAKTAGDLYGFDVTLKFDSSAFDLVGASLSDQFGTNGDNAYFASKPVVGRGMPQTSRIAGLTVSVTASMSSPGVVSVAVASMAACVR